MNNVVKQGLCTVILVFFCSSYLQAALYAEIDREQVSIGERFYLTLEMKGEHTSPPDLSNLDVNFRLSPALRSVLTTHKTGQRDIRTRWLIALRPKHAGRLEIPAFTFMEQASEPLHLLVSEQLSPSSSHARPQFGTDLRINVIADREQVYRNAQLLVTLDIFHNQPLPDTVDFIPPQIESGRVRTLDLPHTRVDEVSGESFFHTQLRFAVFPDELGLIEISAPGLRLPEQNNFSTTELYADMPDVEVLPPADIDPQQQWLPSNNLFISDTTHALEGNQDLQFIRHLSLVAVGTTLDRLPASLINTAESPFYQLLSRETDEHHSSQGITSQIHETWLISPTRPDELIHPLAEIVWWDTLSEQYRYTQPQQPEIGLQLQKAHLTAAPTVALTDQADLPLTGVDTHEKPPYSILTLAGLALLVLFTTLGGVYAFHQQRRHRAAKIPIVRPAAGQAKPRQIAQKPVIEGISDFQRAAERSENLAFLQLSEACQHNAGKPARSALILWAACFWPNKQIINTESIYQANVSQTLNYLLLDLEHHLKRPQEGTWQGDLLLEAVNTLRRRRNLQ